MKHFWGWVGACLLVASFTAEARAANRDFVPIPVCVRPPDVPPSVDVWSYSAGGQTLLHLTRRAFVQKSYGLLTYTFDPEAPPENTRQLPDPYRQLPCDPKPPPPAPEETKKSAPTPLAPSPAAAPGHAKKVEAKKEEARSPLPPSSTRSERAPEEESARHPRLPEHGVTTDWPSSVLPRTTVLPFRRSNDPCSSLLPMQGRPAQSAQACSGTGDGTKEGVKKTAADKFAEGMAYAAGLWNLQLDEDPKRPDGKPHGILGGRNPKGPDNALAQAAASAVEIVALLLSPGAETFRKKLAAATAKKTTLLMRDMEGVGLNVADEFATKLGQQLKAKALKEEKTFTAEQAEAFIRASLADALEKNGAIGPYEVMQQFTSKLGGQWQAHHILEESMVKRFELGDAAKVPSAILTEVEHKRITAELRAATLKVRDTQGLWKAYRKVYRKYPNWLDAIKPYLVKGK